MPPGSWHIPTDRAGARACLAVAEAILDQVSWVHSNVSSRWPRARGHP